MSRGKDQLYKSDDITHGSEGQLYILLHLIILIIFDEECKVAGCFTLQFSQYYYRVYSSSKQIPEHFSQSVLLP
jgi:hypothetical protein